jgi:hypothetical protein
MHLSDGFDYATRWPAFLYNEGLTSGFRTSETSCDVRCSVAIGGKQDMADITFR